MRSMTNRNSCRENLTYVLVTLAILVVFQPGPAEAQDIEEIRQAAEQGEAKAQNNLGYMYDQGEGVVEDDREAVKWLRKAAEQGHAVAQNNLGIMFHLGRALPKDDREAVNWYRKAAEQGYAGAQYNLGRMYANGEGVPEDYVKAYAWFNLAAAQGNERASELKDELRPRMTTDQVAKAQELAAELFNRIESSKSK